MSVGYTTARTNHPGVPNIGDTTPVIEIVPYPVTLATHRPISHAAATSLGIVTRAPPRVYSVTVSTLEIEAALVNEFVVIEALAAQAPPLLKLWRLRRASGLCDVSRCQMSRAMAQGDCKVTTW
jgi:hypothetical protein